MIALLTAKNVAIFLALATTAFCVSTIVLAVQKSNLEDDLQDALDKLDTISTLTTPTTSATSPITPSPTTESPPNPTTEPTTAATPIVTDSSTISTTSPTHSTPSTAFPWPTMTVPNEPTFPTLPTGLPNPEEIIYRLPLDIRPIKYNLYIHPDLKGKTCEGTVSIQIEVDKETNLIVMHAKNLNIGSVSILNMMARMRIRVRRSYLDSEREMFFIELDELIYTSTPYTVSISYNCQLDGLVGLYTSTYLGANDESRYNETVVQEEDEQVNDVLRLSTKPIIRFRPVTSTTEVPPNTKVILFNKTTLAPRIMATSKVLQYLSFRLPRELKPLRYNLTLQPDLKNKTFSGNVTIRLEVLKPISFIPVHSKFLTVETKEVLKLGDEEKPTRQITPSLTFEHPQFEYWITEFDQPLEVGNYSLQLAFNGSLVDRIVGFYQSSYLDKGRNEKRSIATSKFEPTYARQAFPCFDEPSMKAMFSITIVRPTEDGYHALSNMNVEQEKDIGNGLTEVTFAESVPMSTYLACFIVSDFAHKSKMVKGTLDGADDFEMRVFSTAAQVEKVTYALNVGASVTEFYIDYFNISYPLPKLDMAAIPDFVSGAMEHWGLVTYRETALLYDKGISSSANQQRVATVIAHELAHMWFGNLVTMKWWNDLWLNEGFASYIEYKGVNFVHPDWQMLDQFLIADLHGVMKLDATLASHPIVQTVESPNQITELFDTITYSKGASIIRMLEDLVGAEKFRNGTTNYLNNFYYSNAETNDFLSEMEALNLDFDIKLIMQTWIGQMGLPVVTVSRSGNSYKLTQKRFFANTEDYNGTYEDSEFNYHWSIPITYFTSAASEVQRAIFNYNDNELTITLPTDVDWIKFNKNQVGYYRVNYPTDIWESLTKALFETRGAFSVSDRAHLINDVFALADAGQVDYSIALNLSKYLKNELDYVPWSVAASRLNAIKNLLYFTNLYRDFVDYARQLLKGAYESVTWNVSENHLQNLLRVTILNAACGYGNPEALEEAGKRFTAWLENPAERPNPDIRSTVYYYGMQVTGNEQIWNKVFDLFVAEQDAQEKVKLMEALAAITEPWILQRYINLAWNESYVRGQDYFSCLQYIAQNRIGQPLVWDYVRENWPRMVERFGINERYLGRMIPSITSRFASQTKLDEMEAFFAKYPEAGAGTAARKEALENVKNNKKWLDQNLKPVGEWINSQKSSDAIETTTTTTVNSINQIMK